jgi:hypothetical protein
MKPVVNIFREVVERINLVLMEKRPDILSSAGTVQYMHGHPLEIINRLKQKDKGQSARFNKYPLIALFQDFPEESTANNVGIETEATLHFIIAKGTKREYIASERYEYNFVPFLYPIYEEFLRQIVADKSFQVYSVDRLQRQKWDRLYWGRSGLYGNEGNIFNDYLDVIEIKNLKLKIIKAC